MPTCDLHTPLCGTDPQQLASPRAATRRRRCGHAPARHRERALCSATAGLELQQALQQETGYRLPQAVLEQAELIEEPAAQEMLRAVQWTPVSIPSLGSTVQTAHVRPTSSTDAAPPGVESLPLVLLHSFDSSLLEFRRLWPRLLQAGVDAWAVDLMGWGFSAFDWNPQQDAALGPVQKREHLYAFWQQEIKRPMVLLGTSLGGAIAVDFAVAHPDAVAGIILCNPQGYSDGVIGLPKPLAYLGVQVLRSKWLRNMANQMAYRDKASFATEDAMRIGRLHTFLPGWADANVAFIQSRGYSVSASIPRVRQPALVLWGRQDEVLDPKLAARFQQDLPHCRLEWIEECGHCGHLEKPGETASLVQGFLEELQQRQAKQ